MLAEYVAAPCGRGWSPDSVSQAIAVGAPASPVTIDALRAMVEVCGLTTAAGCGS
ncbi:hypothetical protein [Actinomadura rugatobispora]|uniref:Uncharacterized protein n=1 Tax=Actinomadura rugatobispora TaxID=1994 RepID=A0ABW1A2R2_9ACTN|nr:hypothetical protein GCM10010200_007770 [Actinomadura rugatobispora]